MSTCWCRNILRLLAPVLVLIFLVALTAEVEAGRRGGGRGGGFRGGGISRGGPARGGSIRHERSGGGYRSYDPGSRSGRDRYGSMDRGETRSRRDPGSAEREGGFENRRGETIDYESTVTRTDEGLHREGSWSSTSGASGGGSGDFKVSDGKLQSSDRSRHAESASGETLDRQIESERHGDHMDREGQIQSSTGIDAESQGTVQKTDDGFIAQGGIVGDEGAAAGTIVRDGDQTFARGVATDGTTATWGRVHCTGSHCYGGRVTADVGSYYRYSYYYYPYYYYWYSCPYGGVSSWYNQYGAPVYSCANVVVIHTTISLGMSDSSDSSGGYGFAEEAKVASAAVMMYEVSPEVSVYATPSIPVDVYAVRDDGFYYWLPGPAKESDEVNQLIAEASELDRATGNSTVITYAAAGRTIYLTNERPIPGYYSEQSDHLFVWLPGVKDPTDEEKELVGLVISAHREGGQAALDREVRKLEEDREEPPGREGEVS